MSELEINYENLSLISGIIGHSGVTVGSIVYLTSTAVILTGKISNQVTKDRHKSRDTIMRSRIVLILGGAFVLAAYLIRKIWENATESSIQERNK